MMTEEEQLYWNEPHYEDEAGDLERAAMTRTFNQSDMNEEIREFYSSEYA